jgi:hypothetical protein
MYVSSSPQEIDRPSIDEGCCRFIERLLRGELFRAFGIGRVHGREIRRWAGKLKEGQHRDVDARIIPSYLTLPDHFVDLRRCLEPGINFHAVSKSGAGQSGRSARRAT